MRSAAMFRHDLPTESREQRAVEEKQRLELEELAYRRRTKPRFEFPADFVDRQAEDVRSLGILDHHASDLLFALSRANASGEPTEFRPNQLRPAQRAHLFEVLSKYTKEELSHMLSRQVEIEGTGQNAMYVFYPHHDVKAGKVEKIMVKEEVVQEETPAQEQDEE